jgi:hypothetical protein
MNNDRSNHGIELVDQATDALRSAEGPGGPSPMLTQRTLAAVWAAEAKAERSAGVRMRIAAALLLGAAGIAIVIALLHPRKSNDPVRQIAIIPPATQPAKIAPAPSTTEPATPGPVLASAESVTPSPPPGEVAITGHILFEGPTPAPHVIDVSGYPSVGGFVPGPILDDSLVVNADHTLANVTVYISGPVPAGHSDDTPPPILIREKYCMFEPHVVAAMVGQQLILEDDDALPHAVHSINCATTPTFNSPILTRAKRTIDPFPAVDTFQIGCDMHPWMHAWVRVFDHPYFDTTRSDGTFLIKDLPPGTYHLHAWHESLGDQEKTITINGGEPLSIDFTFASPANP